MSNKTKGYTLPPVTDPGALRCVTVYLPDEFEYYVAFWSSFQFLTEWIAWERDDAKRGKDVAAVMRAAFELSRAAWEAGGECMAFQLRQSTTNPCLLEQSIDGGTNWTTAFNYGLCRDAITALAPYPGSTTGAADAASQIVRNLFQELLDMLNCSTQTRDEYIALATAYLRSYDPSFANPAALGALYDAYCAMTPEEQAEAQTDCPYVPHKEDMEGCMSAEGLIDDLQCWSDALAGWLTEVSDALMSALNQIANSLTADAMQQMGAGGAGGGAGFGLSCEGWQHVWNDANGWGTWVVHPGGDYGEYAGDHWKSTTNGTEESLIIEQTPLAADVTIDYMIIEFTLSSVPATGQHRVFYRVGSTDTFWFTVPIEVGPQIRVYIDNISQKWLQIDFEFPDGVHTTISEVIVGGYTGTDPY